MIYSQNINKVCAVCQMAHKKSEDEMYCDIKKQAVSVTDTACDKFKYDILKRHVRRMRKLKTNFNPAGFFTVTVLDMTFVKCYNSNRE